MSTEIQKNPPRIVGEALSIRELAGLLTRHYDLHEGLYDLVVEFQIGTGAVGPDKDSVLPGAFFGISKLGLSRTDAAGPLTVDAGIANPLKISRKRPANRE